MPAIQPDRLNTLEKAFKINRDPEIQKRRQQDQLKALKQEQKDKEIQRQLK